MSVRTIQRQSRLKEIVFGLGGFSRLTFPRPALVIVCFSLVGVVGYFDYLTGYERPMVLFYLWPISLAVWLGSFPIGLVIVVASVVAWLVSDLAAGIPSLRYWNAGMAFTAFALFAGVLAELRTLVNELDRRVQERTAALQREVVERQRLDREIAQVADRERRRLGKNLHGHLGQHLTGTPLSAPLFKEKI